jgi:hypothetical protein
MFTARRPARAWERPSRGPRDDIPPGSSAHTTHATSATKTIVSFAFDMDVAGYHHWRADADARQRVDRLGIVENEHVSSSK